MCVKYIPNLITAVRIISAIFLIPLAVFSFPFYLLYTLCGLTDLADGVVARATRTQSDFGAKLDSIADLVFWAIVIGKVFASILPRMGVLGFALLGVVLLLRAGNYAICLIRFHTFPSLHTWLNKLTGFALFVSIYLLNIVPFPAICITLGVIAIAAVVEELCINFLSDHMVSNTNSLRRVLIRRK